MKFLGIIPARFASTRFPGKMLAKIHGKTMIRLVYEQCVKASLLDKVVIATDNEFIQQECISIGAQVIMTSPDHPSGTDRCFEAFKKLNEPYDFIVNIQGDEPFIKPEQIDMLIQVLSPDVELCTLIKRIESKEILFNTGNVKVVFNKNQEALYFSRQTIPYLRDVPQDKWLERQEFYEHVGLYAYRNDILKSVTSLKLSSLESAESLEQLRWIENGFKIKVQETPYDSFCIETPEDLEAAQNNIQTTL